MKSFLLLYENFQKAEVVILSARKQKVKFNGYTTPEEFRLSLGKDGICFFEELFEIQEQQTFLLRKKYYLQKLESIKSSFLTDERHNHYHPYLYNMNDQKRISLSQLSPELFLEIKEYTSIQYMALCRICQQLGGDSTCKDGLFIWNKSQNALFEYCDAPCKNQYIVPAHKDIPMYLWYHCMFCFLSRELPTHFYSYLYKINNRNHPAAFMQELTENYLHHLKFLD